MLSLPHEDECTGPDSMTFWLRAGREIEPSFIYQPGGLIRFTCLQCRTSRSLHAWLGVRGIVSVTIWAHRLGVADLVPSEHQLTYCSRRLFWAVSRIGIRDCSRAVKKLNSTNFNGFRSVIALKCSSVQPVRKPRRIILRICNVRNICLFHRLHFAVMFHVRVDFAKLLNSAGRGCLTDLWAAEFVEKAFAESNCRKELVNWKFQAMDR